MHNIDNEILEYVNKYYEDNTIMPPEKLIVNILEEEAFYNKIRTKSIEVYGTIPDITLKKLLGLIIIDGDKDNPVYNIYILKNKKETQENIIITLFHELSHINTIPTFPDPCSQNIYFGFEYWKEYIANYTAFKKYNEKINKLGYLNNENEFKQIVIKRMDSLIKKSNIANLQELIPILTLSPFNIKDYLYEKYDHELITEIYRLVNICYKTLRKDDLKHISNINLGKIGNKIIKIEKII